MGIIGVLAIARRRLSDIRLIEKGYSWLLFGTLYGIIVGLLSPAPINANRPWAGVGHDGMRTLWLNKSFFIGFVGLSLLDRNAITSGSAFGHSRFIWFTSAHVLRDLEFAAIGHADGCLTNDRICRRCLCVSDVAYQRHSRPIARPNFDCQRHGLSLYSSIRSVNGDMSKRLILCIDPIGLEAELRQGLHKLNSSLELQTVQNGADCIKEHARYCKVQARHRC